MARYPVEAAAESDTWGEEESLHFPDTAAGYQFGEDKYALDLDDAAAEEAHPTTDIESTMASIRTLATLVASLQDQEGARSWGCAKR